MLMATCLSETWLAKLFWLSPIKWVYLLGYHSLPKAHTATYVILILSTGNATYLHSPAVAFEMYWILSAAELRCLIRKALINEATWHSVSRYIKNGMQLFNEVLWFHVRIPCAFCVSRQFSRGSPCVCFSWFLDCPVSLFFVYSTI